MCLKPQSPQPIPPDTKALVGPLLDEDTVYRFVGDVLFAQFRDEDFADLYPNDGQPALSPVLLSFVLIFQALENLSDRATAFAVAFNVAWKYALHLPLAYPGFDPTVLSEFRQRLLTHNAEARLFTAVFAQLKQLGFFKRKGIQHTDSIVVLTHHRLLHRIELCVETMRTTIKSLLHHDPEWTRATLPAEWEARYAKRCKAERLSEQERQTLSGVVGDDGQWLLERLGQDDAAHLCELCAVSTLRDVWAVHYERCADGHTRWREGDALGSVRRTVTDAGVPLGVVQYDPWGTVESGSVPTFGFTGELQQGGAVYLRARWYNAGQGRFVSRDPFAGAAEMPYSFHPYQYAYSAPTVWSDPSGRDPWWTDPDFRRSPNEPRSQDTARKRAECSEADYYNQRSTHLNPDFVCGGSTEDYDPRYPAFPIDLGIVIGFSGSCGIGAGGSTGVEVVIDLYDLEMDTFFNAGFGFAVGGGANAYIGFVTGWSSFGRKGVYHYKGFTGGLSATLKSGATIQGGVTPVSDEGRLWSVSFGAGISAGASFNGEVLEKAIELFGDFPFPRIFAGGTYYFTAQDIAQQVGIDFPTQKMFHAPGRHPTREDVAQFWDYMNAHSGGMPSGELIKNFAVAVAMHNAFSWEWLDAEQ